MSVYFQLSLCVDTEEDWMRTVGETVSKQGVFKRHERKSIQEQVIVS